jgi:hypothetical protein
MTAPSGTPGSMSLIDPNTLYLSFSCTLYFSSNEVEATGAATNPDGEAPALSGAPELAVGWAIVGNDIAAEACGKLKSAAL